MNYLRFALFPLSMLYGVITSLRNWCYDRGWLESKMYGIPVICVGNLSVGGTGKSPMIEYLIDFLKDEYKVAVLSRGYKRKTKGYLEVTTSHSAEEVGDEPRQFKQKYPQVTIAVCANRRHGIEQLQKKAEVVLLDDGYQHRRVRPSYSILLSDYGRLFLNDYLLPMGRLREGRKGVKRAQVVMVTKCPTSAPYANQQEIQYRLKLKPDQRLYFSRIAYDPNITNATETIPISYLADKPFTLVTGIANPAPLVEYLQGLKYKFEHLSFPDHHAFTEQDINRLKSHELILTTEKDAVRLRPLLKKYALYHLPIKPQILNEQEAFFKEGVLTHIKQHLRLYS